MVGVILLLILFGVVAGTLWFVMINDIIERIKYRKSKCITNGDKNNDHNYNPKPTSVLIIEGNECNNTNNNKDCNGSSQSCLLVVSHIEHIIKKVKLWCQLK